MDQDREDDLHVDDPVDFDAPPPPDDPPRRGPGPGRRPFRWFPPIFFAIAAIVGIERVSMLMFVMREPDADVLIVAGGAFITCVMTVFVVGGYYFGKLRRQ